MQAPVGFDELAERNVVRDSGVTELLASNPVGFESDRVTLAVKRARPPAAALPPTQLPPAVRLAAQIHHPLLAFDRSQSRPTFPIDVA